MRPAFTLLLLLLFISTQASEKKYKLGKVTKKELLNNTCELDPEADAVVLFDIGSSRFTTVQGKGLVLQFSRKTKIKILTTDGVDAANRTIALYKSRWSTDEVSRLKAYSYNLVNGKIEDTKMSKDNIQEEEIHKYKKELKLAIPNVRKGSIIEIEYIVSTEFFDELREWSFQCEYPTIYSRYKTRAIDFLKYRRNLRGFVKIKTAGPDVISEVIDGYHSSSEETIMTAENIPAFKPEPFISARRNYISRVNYELYDVVYTGSVNRVPPRSTWEDYDKVLLDNDNIGGFLEDQKIVHKAVENWQVEGQTKVELMQNCFTTLRDSLKWNDRYSFVNSEGPRKIWRERVGNSADLNLMLILLLREYGIQADPIVISTRDHGYIIQGFPALNQYNHLICRATIDTTDYFLDLTGTGNAAGILPFEDLSLAGRDVLSGRWISIAPRQQSFKRYFFKLKVRDNSSLEGEGQVGLGGYNALPQYKALANLNGNTNKLCEDFRENYTRLNIKEVEVDTRKFPDHQFEIDLKLESTTHCQNLGNMLSIQPFVMEDMENNIMTAEERIFPIDFGFASYKSVNIQLEIPEGYRVKALPEKSIIALPEKAGVIKYQCQDIGSAVLINYELTLNEYIYPAEDYPLLKQFYDLAQQKISEPILLEKI